MNISPQKRMVARRSLDVFGGQPQVFAFQDEQQQVQVDLLCCVDRPFDGVTSYATIGVFEADLNYTMEERSLRIELVSACVNGVDHYANVLATCGLDILQSGKLFSYGAVMSDVVSLYDAATPYKHIVGLTPDLWPQAFEPLEVDDRLVVWILAVAISDEELAFAEEHGAEALEAWFQSAQIPWYDPQRPLQQPRLIEMAQEIE